jgi:hypothetical protein
MNKPQVSDRFSDSEQPESLSQRGRNELVKRIALALVSTTPGGYQEKAAGFDPYNSRMGSSPRDPWRGRRRG